MFDLISKPFGLNISDSSIEIVSLGGTIENPKLLTMGRVVLEPRLIEDGIILNKEKLVDLFKKFIETLPFGGIKRKEFIFSIPESKTFIHNFSSYPDVKSKEFLGTVEKEISQVFPFIPEDLYFDFQLVNSEKEVLAVAAQKKIVDKYLELFSDLKIKPVALENESLSLSRALINEQGLVLIIDIGENMTNFTVFNKKELRLSISNPIAGKKFTKSISEKLNITEKEAELLKQEIGFDSQKEDGKIFLILQKEIQPLLEEVRKIQEYFKEKEEKVFEEDKTSVLEEKKAETEEEIRPLSSERQFFNDKKSQIFSEIEKIKSDLKIIFEREAEAEKKKLEIETMERKTTLPEKRREIEKRRWEAETEREKIETERWEKEGEIEDLEMKIRDIDSEYQEIVKKELKKISKREGEVGLEEEKEEKNIFKKIILTGVSAILPRLREYLSANLQDEVMIVNPLENINVDIFTNKKYFQGISKIHPVFYSAAIGLALRGLSGGLAKKEINLIERKSF